MRALVIAVLVLLSSTTARAQDAQPEEHGHTYRAVVDRVDYEPSSLSGMRLRVFLSALTLGGQRLDLSDAKSVKAYLGGSELKVPYSLGFYEGTKEDTAIVVLVQATLDYQEVLPLISDGLDRDLLGALPDHTQALVLPYGESVATGKLSTLKNLRGKVSLATDNSVTDPALLDTLDRALILLKRAKTDPEGRTLRKIVLVIGDGRDNAADRDRVTRTGQRAAKEGVRIHSIAFSPGDVRRPMLAMGELSKQSLGTFRWVRTQTADSWRKVFEQVRDEIQKQYVVTYFTGAEQEDLAGKKLKVVTVGRTEATSNEVKIGGAACGQAECTADYCAENKCLRYREDGGRGVLGWFLLIGGILVGAVVVLWIIGFVISKKHRKPVPYPAPYPGMPNSYPPGMHPGMQPGGVPPSYPPGVPPSYPPQAQVPPSQSKKQKKQKKGEAPVVAPGMLPNGRPIPALLVMSGPLAGQRFMLQNGFLIGKQPGCHLILPDGAASSQHAQISMDPNGICKVYDRGSTNGTFVNGNQITEFPLQHGSSLRIGSTELRFLAE